MLEVLIAVYSLREVGSFAADWVWRRALKSQDEYMNPIFEEDDALADSPAKAEKVRQDVFRTIKDWTFTMPNLDTGSRGFNVSPKLSKLVQTLQAFKSEGDTFRGIVLGEVSYAPKEAWH
jgi:endoribonuclease Dicer